MRAYHYALIGQLGQAVAAALAARAIQQRTELADEWNPAVPLVLMRVYNCLEDFPAVERETAAVLAMPEVTEPVRLVLVPGARALAAFEAGHLTDAATTARAADAQARRLGLAGKHRSTVTAMARKYKATVGIPAGPRKCLQVVIERDGGRKPLAARFGGIPLKRQRTAVLTGQRPVTASARRNELIHRLLAGRCEICEAAVNLEVHYVRKLADLTRPGRRDKPTWVHLMAIRRRKTLITCRHCHEDIHAGRVTRPYPK